MDKLKAKFFEGFEKTALKSNGINIRGLISRSMRFLDPKKKIKGYSKKSFSSTSVLRRLKRD